MVVLMPPPHPFFDLSIDLFHLAKRLWLGCAWNFIECA